MDPQRPTLFLQPDRNLALELVRATEAAAIRAQPWVGRGEKNLADGAAVDAMRKFLGTVNFDDVVVIGEGEKDNAPMLYNGEHVGNGHGPACDIAVDPIDGTSLTAAGRQNAISVMAVSDRGSMYDPSAVYYMDKIAAGPEGPANRIRVSRQVRRSHTCGICGVHHGRGEPHRRRVDGFLSCRACGSGNELFERGTATCAGVSMISEVMIQE